MRTHARQALAYFSRQPPEKGLNHFRFPCKTGAQFFILRRDAHRASVQVTLPRHHATESEQSSRAEAKFVGAKQSSKDHITRELEAAVHAQAHTATQAGLAERNMCIA